MQEQVQAIVTVLSLVNPAICGMMFAQVVAGRSRGAQLIDATKAALAVLVVLVAAALVGTKLLHLFGVSLDAFMVAGGGVLAWMGFSMLSGRPAASASPSADSSAGPSLTPLILFAASPGTNERNADSRFTIRAHHPNREVTPWLVHASDQPLSPR